MCSSNIEIGIVLAVNLGIPSTVHTKQLTMLVLLGLALATLAILGCQEGPDSTPGNPEEVIVNQLAAEYRAITGWEEDFTYTFEVQERLTTGQPTLFRGRVDDVFNRDGKTIIRFSHSLFYSFVFELECSRSILETVLARTSDDPIDRIFGEYAVVADIQEVSKAVVALEPSAYSSGSGEDAILDLEISIEPSELFIVRGTCIDIVYVPRPP